MLAFLDDLYVADIANAGPDKGNGGELVVLPLGYKDEERNGYSSPALTSLAHGPSIQEGDTRPGTESIKD